MEIDRKIRILSFIKNRMIEIHGENKNVDYMIRLGEIIEELESTELKSEKDSAPDTLNLEEIRLMCNMYKLGETVQLISEKLNKSESMLYLLIESMVRKGALYRLRIN